MYPTTIGVHAILRNVGIASIRVSIPTPVHKYGNSRVERTNYDDNNYWLTLNSLITPIKCYPVARSRRQTGKQINQNGIFKTDLSLLAVRDTKRYLNIRYK